VLTKPVNHVPYEGIRSVKILHRLDDEQLRDAYRKADLVFMPLLDCTANNAILEAMACGTPVMVNRIGGVPEYVDEECNLVMDGKDVRAWADRLRSLARNRSATAKLRVPVHRWAEKFSWPKIADAYRSFYAKALNS
jgi:glycosyltransferase involved in cell wall biosynthesis